MEKEEAKERLAYNIKKIRKDMRLSQFELAEKADISEQTIISIENQRLWPSDKTITKICNTLSCDIYRLFLPRSDALQMNDRIYKELEETVTTRIKNLVIKTLDAL